MNLQDDKKNLPEPAEQEFSILEHESQKAKEAKASSAAKTSKKEINAKKAAPTKKQKANKPKKEVGEKINPELEFDPQNPPQDSSVKILNRGELKKLLKANNKPWPKDANAHLDNTEGYIVEVENLTKTYISGNVATNVLKGISFSIKRGEIAILYGKSGSGKSTLLNIMSALDRPTSGKIVVNNISLPYLSDRKQTMFRRKNISFIFQNYNLLQNLNSYDNVETGAYLQADKSKKINIRKLFKEFDLLECMYKYPSQMSGGQQQRVSILRALAKNSEIIVADEPTGALDEKTGKIVLKILQEINRDYHSTIIIVSHDPDIAELADKVIWLENGKIREIKEQKRKSLISEQPNIVVAEQEESNSK
ncbi:ABC transporter ATP-binding protein [Metamycoplasma hyosynoviae]|uniref:Putative ABC transport system ATP-binding protein n=1 Tax=Metamycoplasma hyosynoviae TaxID=29559 RepID=A0A4R7U0L4_9BACT|nr:ABC transporter ATP-binding protein [Metamycoplasma hyosynoviae]TDU98156.1 putative ABC transport system ATP-binding protein [Metamycoplasma hyosynoviae]